MDEMVADQGVEYVGNRMYIGEDHVVCWGTLGSPFPNYVVGDVVVEREEFLERYGKFRKEIEEFEKQHISKCLWSAWEQYIPKQKKEAENKPHLTDAEKQEEEKRYDEIRWKDREETEYDKKTKAEAEQEEQENGMLEQEARECTLWERDEYEED